MSANKCPKCKIFLLSSYCGVCHQDIKDMRDDSYDDIPDFLKDIFNGKI